MLRKKKDKKNEYWDKKTIFIVGPMGSGFNYKIIQEIKEEVKK